MLSEHILLGETQSELNTEIRFLVASATVDNKSLMLLRFGVDLSERDQERIKTCVIKVLRVLKREGIIQFFVTREGFELDSTEANFLTNKFGDYIQSYESGYAYIKL